MSHSRKSKTFRDVSRDDTIYYLDPRPDPSKPKIKEMVSTQSLRTSTSAKFYYSNHTNISLLLTTMDKYGESFLEQNAKAIVISLPRNASMACIMFEGFPTMVSTTKEELDHFISNG